MLRVKLSKLKQVCATALLPRIFKETKFFKNKIDKCSVAYLGKIKKSTDSGSNDEENEKQMRIVDKCFPEKATVIDMKHYNDETNELLKERHIEGDIDDRQKTLKSKGFEYEKNEDLTNTGKLIQDGYLESTTAKIDEEKLTQKIDHIDETPHVEAGVGKIEGFNVTPRVLGHDKNIANGSAVKHTDYCEQGDQVNLDELAKRCLSSPAGDIDNILLKELKNMSRNSQKMKVNFPTNDSAQKYFSQAFENSTGNNNLVSEISDTHLQQAPNKDEKGIESKEKTVPFQPFQLDTIPVFPIDVNGIRYKQNEFTTEYSPAGNNLLLDIPAVLEPYDMQAIPFYEYVSKENILLQEIPSIEAVETNQAIDVKTPMNEEVILERNLDEQESLTDKEAKELEETESAELNPTIIKTIQSVKTTETQKLSDSDVSKLLEYKNVISSRLDVSEKSNITSDKISSSQIDETCVLTSTIDEPPNLDSTFQNESSNSAISNAYPATNTRRSLELPENTAISANQKPEEYFELPKDNFQSLEESSIKDPEPIVNDSRVTNLTFADILYSNIKVSDTEVIDDTFTDTIVSAPKVFDTRNPENIVTNKITSDNPVTQSVTYSAKPEFLEMEEDNRQIDNSVIVDINRCDYLDGPITHLLFQPELKQQDNIETESSCTTKNNASLCSEDTIPLSMLLKQVRERNRLEFNRAVFLKIVPKPEEAKKVTCVPPLDRNKPKTTLSPNPCQPKPKSPEKPKCPQPCPPKKDPCAKFTPFFLDTIIKSDLSLDRSFSKHIYSQIYTYIASFSLKEVTMNKFKEMSQFLDFLSVKRNVKANSDDVVCTRDFEPWVPIPSWPMPKVDKKRPLVCPKEGCKLPLQPIPSNTDKSCVEVPKKISPNKIYFTPFVFDGYNSSF